MFNMRQQETGKPNSEHLLCVTSAGELGPVSEPFQVLSSALRALWGCSAYLGYSYTLLLLF